MGNLSTVCVLALAATVLPAQSPDFELAREAFARAAQESDNGRKQVLLEESIRLMKSFEAYYALGNLQLDRKQFIPALESFREAMAVAKNESAVAAARFKLGLASEGAGDILAAIALLESSLALTANDTVAVELKRIRFVSQGKVHDAAAMEKALALSKSLGKSAKIDLNVNFNFNSVELTAAGKHQAEELGKLLTQSGFSKSLFVFVGHTDVKGGEDYNLSLSGKRAEAVRNFLVERYPIAYNRVRTEGRGKREPLYPGPASEVNDKLNRRVEVRISPRP